MAVTRSWEAKVLAVAGDLRTASARIGWRQFGWLAGASILVAIGLALVYSAKTQNFPDLSARLDRGELLDLNRVTKPEQLDPFLQIFPSEVERGAVARKTFDYLAAHRPIRNAGALNAIIVQGLSFSFVGFQYNVVDPLNRVIFIPFSPRWRIVATRDRRSRSGCSSPSRFRRNRAGGSSPVTSIGRRTSALRS